MRDPYTALGLDIEADDEAIRQAYLNLTKKFPPEQYPDKAAQVRAAYDKIRTAEARARYFLLMQWAEDSIETLIEETECRIPRPRPGLQKLLSVVLNPVD